jgi:hypothetical protein
MKGEGHIKKPLPLPIKRGGTYKKTTSPPHKEEREI